jgi:hypothetical protein
MTEHAKPSALPTEAPNPADELMESDAGMVRVLEDLIDVLIQRGVIQFTDLPVPAQTKLLQRRESRAHLADRLDLLGEDADNGLI